MDSSYFGLEMTSESSFPTSSPSSRRTVRKRSRISIHNSQDEPKPPQRGLGVAQLERLRLQDQLIRSHLNHIGSFGSSNQQLQNPNQGNQWSSQGSYSSPSFPFLLPSNSPSEHQPRKMMKFCQPRRANNKPHPRETSRPNPSPLISNMVTMQNQQGEKDCIQEQRDADWLSLSLGSSSWTESEADADQVLDLELKL